MVDFIDPGFWPVFNVADSAVVIGCILLVINLLLNGDGARVDEGDDDTGDADVVPDESSTSPSV